jgi:hypothetical protein
MIGLRDVGVSARMMPGATSPPRLRREQLNRRATAVAGSWSDLAGRAVADLWHMRQAGLPPAGQTVICTVCHAARLHREVWGRLEDAEVAVCAECLDRWAATGQRCAACGQPVSPDEVAYVPAGQDLGHVRCGGLGLRRLP